MCQGYPAIGKLNSPQVLVLTNQSQWKLAEKINRCQTFFTAAAEGEYFLRQRIEHCR